MNATERAIQLAIAIWHVAEWRQLVTGMRDQAEAKRDAG